MDNVKKKENKPSKVITTIIMVIVFILCIYVMIAGTKAITENKLLMFFGYNYSVVASPSMEPEIMTNDVIIVKNSDYSDLEIGDIIVYYNSELQMNIVHRIIAVYEDGTFQTKGDNNNSADTIHVSEDIYLGKVVTFGKFLGIGHLINNGRDFIFVLIILIFGYLMISEIINIIKTLKEKDKLRIEQTQKEQINKDLDEQKEKLKQEVLAELEKENKGKKATD